MNTYIVCQEFVDRAWAVCVYNVSKCQRIVESKGEGDYNEGFVVVNGNRNHFKMAIFANDDTFLRALNEVSDWCEEDNDSAEKEAKDGNAEAG